MPATPLPIPNNRTTASTIQQHLDDHSAIANVVNDALVKTLFDAKGNLLIGTGPDTFAVVSVGANGTVPTADSAQASGIKWAVPSASKLLAVSSNKTTAYTLTTADEVVTGDATSAAFTFSLPTAVGNTGKVFHIKRLNAGANVITIDGFGSENIDGSPTYQLTAQWESVTIVSNSTYWFVL